jgi:hypothetical protein
MKFSRFFSRFLLGLSLGLLGLSLVVQGTSSRAFAAADTGPAPCHHPDGTEDGMKPANQAVDDGSKAVAKLQKSQAHPLSKSAMRLVQATLHGSVATLARETYLGLGKGLEESTRHIER